MPFPDGFDSLTPGDYSEEKPWYQRVYINIIQGRPKDRGATIFE